MFSKLHARLGTAGLVVAVVALVVALAGTAFAALPGLNSKQKAEVKKIAKNFAGPQGPQGSQGPQGPAGSAGAAGVKGDKGDKGETGDQGEVGAAGSPGSPGAGGKSVLATPLAGNVGENCEGVGGTEFEVEGSGTSEWVCNGEKGAKGDTGSPWAAGGTLPENATETGKFAVVSNGDQTVFGCCTAMAISFPIPLAEPPEQAIYVTGSNATCKGTVNDPTAPSGILCIYQQSIEHLTSEGFLDMTTVGGIWGFSEAAGTPGWAIGSWAVTG